MRGYVIPKYSAACQGCGRRFRTGRKLRSCTACGATVRQTGVKYYPVTEPDTETDGKRTRNHHGGYDTAKEAKGALSAILHDMSSGGHVGPCRQSVGEHLDEWLRSIQATVKPSTWDSYARNVRLHILPKLGQIALPKLNPRQLNDLYASLGQEGLSSKTIHYIHTILHRALKDAVRWQKLNRNVAALADPPRVKAPAGLNIWSADQVRAFLGFVNHDRLYALYLLALTTGMRRGELLGLRWCDIDLDAGRVRVCNSLIAVAYRIELSEPKTNRSKRVIMLDPATVAALRTHRTRQLEDRLGWGPAWQDNGFVFVREDGGFIHPHSLSHAFEQLVKSSELPRIRFHDLRHTYATLALESGMKPWDLSDRLGHASVAFTLNVYRHAVQATQDSAALAAARFILG